jgi:hypothetical protein
VSKNKKIILTAVQLQALPISIGEARKLLGNDALTMTDNEVALQVLTLNELAIFVSNNINFLKVHL